MTNDKDSAVTDNATLEAFQKDTGIPHLPTQETYQLRMAVSGQGPLAYQWSDKPHRLLYAACRIIESQAALRQPTQSDALKCEYCDNTGICGWDDNPQFCGECSHGDAAFKGWNARIPVYALKVVREKAIEECAKALEADAMKCDCAAVEERECGCGAWCEWKSITSARAVEIVRAVKESK